MAGRPRKPSDMKIIYGTFRDDRSPGNEPKPEKVQEVPRPPSYLGKYAKKLWKQMVVELTNTGILTIVDIPALEITCELYHVCRSGQEAVFHPIDPKTGKRINRTLAEYMDGKNSQTMPEYTAMMKASYMLKAYLTEFGLTPASRGRLDIPKIPGEEDPVKRLYNEA